MKISGFENIICIDAFAYHLAVDQHEECNFTVSVSDRETYSCIGQLGNKCTVENDDFKFCGTVTEISVKRYFSSNSLDVKIKGDTIKYDSEKKYRIFQNENKTASDILNCTSMSEAVCFLEEDKTIREIIVQQNETDWDFALRFAHYLNKHIYPGETVRFGDPEKKIQTLEEKNIIDMTLTLREKKSECYCTTRKNLNFGGKVKINGKVFVIDEYVYRLLKEEYIREYHLTEYCSDNVSGTLPCYTLLAKVTDNNDPDKKGRLKLEFTEPYEDVMKDQPCMLEMDSLWASKSNGLVTIPSIDDIVTVDINDKTARVTAVRRTEPFGDAYEDCNTKYILISKNIYALWNEEKLHIQFGDKTELTIDEESITGINDKSLIKTDEKGVHIDTGKTQAEFQDGTKLKTDSLEIDAQKKAGITSSKVDIKGKSGVNIN